MGFQPIEVKTKSKGAFQIRMVKSRGSLERRMLVSIPTARLRTMLPGDPDFVAPLLGDGENSGQLLLVPATAGLKIAHMKFCAMIRLPQHDVFPDQDLETFEPAYRVVDWADALAGKALLIELPEWATNRERAAAIAAARTRNDEERVVERAIGAPDLHDSPEKLPDFTRAPAHAKRVWEAIRKALPEGERSVRLTPKGVAEIAGVPGGAAINALAWLSMNNVVARQPGGRGQPDIRTPVAP